jgi:hypothetical protein
MQIGNNQDFHTRNAIISRCGLQLQGWRLRSSAALHPDVLASGLVAGEAGNGFDSR